jgi:hypothetical protein
MRRGLIGAVVSVFIGFVLAGFAIPASADTGDVVNRMLLDYTVGSDGVVHVKETIDYHFGASGRHGIYRNLVTREIYKDDTSKDQKYEVSNVTVSSQPPAVSSEFTEDTTKSSGQRDQSLQIKIGSADRTISGTDASYVIQYDVRGACGTSRITASSTGTRPARAGTQPCVTSRSTSRCPKGCSRSTASPVPLAPPPVVSRSRSRAGRVPSTSPTSRVRAS